MTENKTGYDEPKTQADSVLKLAEAMFRGAVWWMVGTVVLGVVVFGVLLGLPGVLGALVGGLLACASSLVTLLMMRRTTKLDPQSLMVAMLGGYVGKMLVLLVVMLLLRGIDVLHPKALAFTMLAVVIVAAAAETRAFQRTKIPTIIPASDKD